jgi:hypothetical protein
LILSTGVVDIAMVVDEQMLANPRQLTSHALYAQGLAKSVSPAAMEPVRFVMVVEKRT